MALDLFAVLFGSANAPAAGVRDRHLRIGPSRLGLMGAAPGGGAAGHALVHPAPADPPGRPDPDAVRLRLRHHHDRLCVVRPILAVAGGPGGERGVRRREHGDWRIRWCSSSARRCRADHGGEHDFHSLMERDRPHRERRGGRLLQEALDWLGGVPLLVVVATTTVLPRLRSLSLEARQIPVRNSSPRR